MVLYLLYIPKNLFLPNKNLYNFSLKGVRTTRYSAVDVIVDHPLTNNLEFDPQNMQKS